MKRSYAGLNLCVFASGGGSNLRSIIRAHKAGKIASKVSLIISNNSGSGALKTAQRNNIPAYHLSQLKFETEKKFVDEILRLLNKYRIDLIVLAGYMKMLSPRIVRKYKGRILNIHPSLLPKFGGKGMYGMNVHRAVIESRDKFSGASVHLVDQRYDNGAVILQKKVRVKDDDTPETLAARVLRVEHRIYSGAIKLYEQNKIKIHGRKAEVLK